MCFSCLRRGTSPSHPSATKISASESPKLRVYSVITLWPVCFSYRKLLNAINREQAATCATSARCLCNLVKPQMEGGGGRGWQETRLSGCSEDDMIDRTGTEPTEWKWQFALRFVREESLQTTAVRFNMTSPDVLHMNYSCLHALSACRMRRGFDARSFQIACYLSQGLH